MGIFGVVTVLSMLLNNISFESTLLVDFKKQIKESKEGRDVDLELAKRVMDSKEEEIDKDTVK